MFAVVCSTLSRPSLPVIGRRDVAHSFDRDGQPHVARALCGTPPTWSRPRSQHSCATLCGAEGYGGADRPQHGGRPKPAEDDRSAVGEVRPRHESELGLPALSMSGQAGRGSGAARCPGRPQQAEIGGVRHRRRIGGVDRSRGCRGQAVASPGKTPHDAGQLRGSAQELCARPKPSSTPPRLPWRWPRTSSATPRCAPTSTASSRPSALGRPQVVNMHQKQQARRPSMYTWANLHIGSQRSKRFCPSAISGERHPGRLGKQPRVA